MRQLLTFDNAHIFVCGITRSGKTYFVKNALDRMKYPAIFFNIQNEAMPARFFQANEITDFKQIERHLKAGGKINLTFSNACRMADIMKIEAFIIRQLMAAGYSEQRPVYVAIDEAQLLAGSALSAANDAATRGLMRGVRLISITQRPALCSKTLYTQSADHYLFRLGPAERSYMQNKGIDFDTAQNLWEQNGKYSYIYFDGINLQGFKAI